jgi:hypothetical protein
MGAAPDMSGRMPDFVIIGAMKAATSTLQAQLAAQAGIFMSTPKEPNFFSDEAAWVRGLGWYRGLFEGTPAGWLCGEASTHYTKLPTHPDALPRIAEHLPDARFIYMMRHPIDRLISHYAHGWLERSIDGPIDAAIDRWPELIDYGRYAMQIAPWLERFGPDRILPVFMERMIASPQSELERIARFIGHDGPVQWRDDVEAQNVSGERLRDSRLRDVIVYSAPVTFIRHHLIPQAVRDRIKKRWQMTDKPCLGPDALARVTAIFDADLATLGPMLGIELDCAGYKQAISAAAPDWSIRSDRPTSS